MKKTVSEETVFNHNYSLFTLHYSLCRKAAINTIPSEAW